ncbi:MAG: hypothetical protein ACR2QC_02435 [Gammaproteobacteria bacterium]
MPLDKATFDAKATELIGKAAIGVLHVNGTYERRGVKEIDVANAESAVNVIVPNVDGVRLPRGSHEPFLEIPEEIDAVIYIAGPALTTIAPPQVGDRYAVTTPRPNNYYVETWDGYPGDVLWIFAMREIRP